MPEFRTIAVERNDAVLRVSLNRPDLHNAFDDELIAEATELFAGIDADVRVVVLAGRGKNFCAGADLNWMARMAGYTRDENVRDASALATMFTLMNECPVPIVGRIHGAAIGGGVGLVSVCDIAIAEQDTKFGLSEVKLGILPAVISPYVAAKIGESHARALLFTGERFGSDRALRIGLVHRVAGGEEELDREVADTVEQVLSSGPEAVRACKRLVAFVSSHERSESVPYTIDAIAERRVSSEGQAGMKAFLDKRKAPWVPK